MLRMQLHLTQSQLADLTGYSDKTAISRIENGENELNQSKLQVFADALHTTPVFLMGYVNEPSAKLAKDKRKDDDVQNAYETADEKTKRAVRILLGLE